MLEREHNTNIIKELKQHIIILENRLNDIGYHYFVLTNNEFELDIKSIKTLCNNCNYCKNCNYCNKSAKWIVLIILLLKKKIKYYENLNKKKQYYFITKVLTIMIFCIIINITMFFISNAKYNYVEF
jgi:hypothetical protein